jgi:hypothetical protein
MGSIAVREFEAYPHVVKVLAFNICNRYWRNLSGSYLCDPVSGYDVPGQRIKGTDLVLFRNFVEFTFRETYTNFQPLLPQTAENVRIHREMENALENKFNTFYRLVPQWDAKIRGLEDEVADLKSEVANLNKEKMKRATDISVVSRLQVWISRVPGSAGERDQSWAAGWVAGIGGGILATRLAAGVLLPRTVKHKTAWMHLVRNINI